MSPDTSWMDAYKKEPQPSKRRAILEKAAEAAPEDEAVLLRSMIAKARYIVKDGGEIDTFIRGWVSLQMLNMRLPLPGDQKRVEKAVDEIKTDWQFPLCGRYGETGEQALKDELFNMTLRYIETCKTDKTYNSVLLGLGQIKPEKWLDKLVKEIRTVTTELPEKLRITEQLEPFPESARAALRYAYPEAADKI